MGIGLLSAAAILEVGAASVLYLAPRELDGEFGGIVTAGAIDTFPPGSVTQFPTGRFFLIRTQDGGFLAVHSRCPHLGCSVNWSAEQNHFYCPCHASSFDLYGDFTNPPVPRPLDIFPVKIVEATVQVDTARLLKRQRFTPDQLAYA
jgi:Rieske Fe-S protein